jgi:predicted transcriptional regulator
VRIVQEIIQEIETGQRTSGNIDVVMQVVEVQFAVAQSHVQGGARVSVPMEDRVLHIPSH